VNFYLLDKGKRTYFIISDNWYVIFRKGWVNGANYDGCSTGHLTPITLDKIKHASQNVTGACEYLYLTNILNHGDGMEKIREWS
jgi:hypothetical protein